MTEPADLLAVQRAHAEHGHDAALAEIRRRWPMISSAVVEQTLDRIMAARVDQPARFSRDAQRDPPGHTRSSRRRP